MKRYVLCFAILHISYGLQAKDIQQFMQLEPPQSKRFQCAYQKRVAEKPCVVSLHLSEPEHPSTKQYFGNTAHLVLKIQWPDGQSSRYAFMSSYQLLNIRNEQHYHFKTAAHSTAELDFSDGLIILDQQNEHIRLW
jgi:hypothetical protein